VFERLLEVSIVKLNKLKLEINVEKKRLEELFSAKGCTDFEVLRQADKVDQLINQYDRMVTAIVNELNWNRYNLGTFICFNLFFIG
jgi:hypothetical protein